MIFLQNYIFPFSCSSLARGRRGRAVVQRLTACYVCQVSARVGGQTGELFEDRGEHLTESVLDGDFRPATNAVTRSAGKLMKTVEVRLGAS